ncbi:LTA synthase family protein [Motilimonas cestriensis]|uniref:LTA synthase family protein n=1 Tax=Motilimonas cestriensis TaxID=2742685 RepID=UPI003DA674CF
MIYGRTVCLLNTLFTLKKSSACYGKDINTRNNTVKYSDWAIGEFFKQAKQSSYWDNTIFIVIADHDHDNSPKTGALVPVDRFHIPALILGKGITARQDQRLVSNIDMPPTLLSLIGAKNVSPMLGHDMTKTLLQNQERALMPFDRNFGYLTNDKLIVFAPEKAPQAFTYDAQNNQQQVTTMSQDEQLNAQAHALWGSLAYQKGLYQAVKLAP